MYQCSERKARQYAERCNADYYVVKDPSDWKPGTGKHVAYQKFKLYDFSNYDKILYIDADYIIKDNAPNIFDLYDNFAAVVDPGDTKKLSQKINIPQNRYFNSGFLFFTKDVLDKTRPLILSANLDTKWSLKDQCLWNKIMYDAGIDYVKLNPLEWNPVDTTFGTYGDHYSGENKNKWGQVIYQ
jgi:lipopolysaccharide biosynthesis glycosyltransferase